MALELVAAIIAAITLGLIAWALRRHLGERMPKWSVPLAAGLGLIGFTVWSEYDWFGRVSGKLPPGIEVVWHADEAQPLRPWTYLAPITTRFTAIDARQPVVHPTIASLRIVQLYNFARWRPVEDAMMAVDCAGDRRVMLVQGAEITAEGQLVGAEWQSVTVPDDLQKAAMPGGSGWLIRQESASSSSRTRTTSPSRSIS
ncbi:MAG: hypothetical protein HC844_10645 [Tabrizicola sp.]|nr:hypothetical protein [Tabrizicola sp.]